MADDQPRGGGGNVALYWDLENVHVALAHLEAASGGNARGLVDMHAVVGFAAAFGRVVIHRAYANWQALACYRTPLLDHSIDLVQLFPRGKHGKNGADIRLALDVMEDLSHCPHITHVVIVSGDSDFVALAQKVRLSGRAIAGVGVEGATNAYWVKACDAFTFYGSLCGTPVARPVLPVPAPPVPKVVAQGDLHAARSLLVRAVDAIAQARGEPFVPKAALRPALLQLDPTFDERRLGFSSFTAFLKACDDVVRVVVGEHDHMVGLATDDPVEGDDAGPPPIEPFGPPPSTRDRYHRLLWDQKLWVADPAWTRRALIELCKLFEDTPDGFDTLGGVDTALVERLAAAGLAAEGPTVRRFRNVLYKTKAFRYGVGKRVHLRDAPGAEALAAEIERNVIKRLVQLEGDALDGAAVCELLYGDPATRFDEVTAAIRGPAT